MSERASERASERVSECVRARARACVRACARRVIYGKINYGSWRNTVMVLDFIAIIFYFYVVFSYKSYMTII